MKDLPWMPMYWPDYHNDTQSLTRELHGSYLLLISSYWATGPLEDDDNSLMAIAKCPATEWPATRARLVKFFEVKNGVWRHKRIDLELSKSKSKSKSRSKAGKFANEVRWSCQLTPESVKINASDHASVCDPKRIPDASQTHPQSQSQSQSHSQSDPESESDSQPQSPREGAVAPRRHGQETDAEWFLGLKKDPAYEGLDVDREFAKCLRWCKENRRQASRRMFVNWLNHDRAARPSSASSTKFNAAKFTGGF